MPIYEYECGACRERTEFIQKFSESPKRKCPSCGRQRLKRLVSAAAFHLKGDGWYVTDFRDKKKKKNGEDSKDSKDTGASSEDGTSKSGDKAETKPSKSESSSDSKSESQSGTKSKSGKPAAGAAAD